jgi:hypothetical protein
MIRGLGCVIACFCLLSTSAAQTIGDTITADVIRQHLSYLSADSLKGRGNYTKDLQRAAGYIAAVYATEGLAAFPGDSGYFQPFSTKNLSAHDYQLDTQGLYNPGKVLLNIIGVLPGKTKPEEVILFSAHYDHMGVDASVTGDSIYNGANDNASGVSALLALAHYYSLRQDNARTLIFAAFAGEELGLVGSQMFARNLLAKAVKAHINIEMIGHSTVGSDAFFITGASHSDLAAILKKNLKGNRVKIIPEPDLRQQLFKRSDNYPFALKGVPAHTVMCSDDSYPCYHAACDEISQMDLENMTHIVQGIARGCQTLVNGTQVPIRIKRIN